MKYIAFPRGINVGGVKIKMADLKVEFENHGFTEVQTILNTGNVIFSSDSTPDLSFLSIKTFVRTDKEVRQLLTQIPFEKMTDKHIYVFISSSDFVQKAMEIFVSTDRLLGETAQVVNGIFYWQVPIGHTTDSFFAKEINKKKYAEQFTNRNLNTIEKIIKKL